MNVVQEEDINRAETELHMSILCTKSEKALRLQDLIFQTVNLVLLFLSLACVYTIAYSYLVYPRFLILISPF